MIYFFNSTRKSDKLSNPITVCATNERRATALAIINFLKNGYKGSPKLIILWNFIGIILQKNVSI